LIGVGAALLAFGVLMIGAWSGGEVQEFIAREGSILRERDARAAVLICVMIGFVPTAQYYVARFTRKNLVALAGNDARLELRPPSRLAFTLPGALGFPLIAFGVDRDPLLYFQPMYYLGFTHWFQWIAGIFTLVNAAWLVHLTLDCARAVEARARRTEKIDLFDLSTLTPFARQGLQSVLVWLLLLSMFSVNAVDPGFYVPTLGIAVLSGGVALRALLLSNLTIHHRVRAAKRTEIEGVDAALRGDPDAVKRLSVSPTAGSLSVADLLSYRTFVAEAREWAFDGSAWVRFALVLALPVGSWLGGAIVERLVEASVG
jgi:hypothetical protein